MSLFKNTTYFYHSHVRRVVSIFGYLFSDITIARFNSEGAIDKLISPVPIKFANEDPDLALNREHVNSGIDGGPQNGFKEEFPRMTYTLDDIQFNSTRSKSKNNTIRWVGEDGVSRTTNQPLNYVASFTLHFIAKNHSDALQGWEQIAAAFDPTVVVKIKDHPAEGCIYDMPFSLTGTEMEDNYEDAQTEKRRVVYSMSFDVMFNLYGPTGSRFEYDALLKNIKQESNCCEDDMNDLNNLRGKSSKLDKMIDQANSLNEDPGAVNEIVLKFSNVPFRIFEEEGTREICSTPLIDLPLEEVEALETEIKVVSDNGTV